MMRLTNFCLLLVTVPQVAGFGSAPLKVGGRTINGDRVPCTQISNATGSYVPGTFDNFCFYNKQMELYCSDLRSQNMIGPASACKVDATSQSCKSYLNLIDIGECPPIIDAASYDLCQRIVPTDEAAKPDFDFATRVKMTNLRKLTTPKWCYEAKDEAECENTYVTYKATSTEPMVYMGCRWIGKKCTGHKSAEHVPKSMTNGINYDIVQACEMDCEDKAYLSGTKLSNDGSVTCSRGADSFERLGYKELCESSYYTLTGAQADLDQDYACKWFGDDETCTGILKPSCNCGEAKSSGMPGASCKVEDVLCCNGGVCQDCGDVGVVF